MAKKLTVKAEAREVLGTGPCRRLRRAGAVPAVLYGHGAAAAALTLAAEEIPALLHHPGLITLKIGGQRGTVSGIVKEVQRHPITGDILHIDLQEVKADEMVTTMVTIEPHGEPVGHQHGGQLEQVLHEVEVRCQAADMFDSLTVEVGGMELDDVMHVKDLVFPGAAVPTVDPDLPVFQVRLPRIEELEAEEGEVSAAAAEAEPGEGEATVDEAAADRETKE